MLDQNPQPSPKLQATINRRKGYPMSEQKTYTVIYEGTVREVYTVTASSEEEARDTWMDNEPDFSESIDGSVTDVMQVEEVDYDVHGDVDE
jgi:hypothetical protein